MEDISQKLSQILSDPKMMEQLKSLGGLLGQQGPTEEPKAQYRSSQNSVQSSSGPETQTASGNASFMPDPDMLGMVMKLAPLLRSANREDDSTRLLLALKPFMHEERSRRIDGAIRLLGILRILPALKSSGIGLFPTGG